MRILRKSGIIALIMLLFVLVDLNLPEVKKTVVKSTGCYIDKQVWGPLVADQVNQEPIRIYLGDRQLEGSVYMDKNMELMISADDVTECFTCSADLYDNTRLVLQKKDLKLEFIFGENDYSVNEVQTDSGPGMTDVDGKYYLPISVLARQFQCDYTWNVQKNELTIQDNWSESIIPERFSLKESRRSTVVKNQGQFGTCWAVAALSALETSVRPEEELLFSADHMSLQNSFSVSQEDGGEYTMAMAYLTAWQGPVLEEDDPYGDKKSPEGLSAVKHVQEIQLIKEKDLSQIKKSVFLYGAVQTSIYTSLKSAASRSVYYNNKTLAYCYTGTEVPNHDIIIIGWDDTYSKDNFNMKVEGDGAFICQNSWGNGFGEEGIFYVSYYDSNVGSQSIVYSRVDDTDNYDHIYQTDLCGWAGQLGYNKDSAFFANVFAAEEKETVRAVGFYATDKNTSYEIYIVNDYQNPDSLRSRTLLQTGTFENAGFYTVDLSQDIIVESGQRFAVVIKITTPGSIHPVAVEYKANAKTEQVDLSDGDGYISLYGSAWSNVESGQACNVCMKIYTDKVQ